MTKQELMFALLEEYEQSKLTIPAFCTEKSIRKSRFHYWHRKFRESRIAPKGFIPIAIPARSEQMVIRLAYPNGVSIELPAADLTFIAQLIRLV